MPIDTPTRHEDLLPQEILFAFLAHIIGPLMIVVDLKNDGPQSIPFLITTALIFLYHRDKSPYVAHHARQALALQFLGTIGFFVLLATGTVMWLVMLIVSIISVLILIGLILIPMVLLTYPLFVLTTLTLPFSVFMLGVLGAWHTLNGYDFDYPVLARLLDRYLGEHYVRQRA